MKINSILLYNFGSYEGKALFGTQSTSNDKNIILIGGKNGAGKTTLFTAIRVCLYGYKSMGYKNVNSFYNRAIIKLINNNAKLKRPTQACVKINIALNNGHEIDNYSLCREWLLQETLTEKFSVSKNGKELLENEVADFEKFLLNLIPPELFNLYFFDGEKIADFFLDEGSNTRIKEAFLTLCGYDIFDIMRRNFKRIGSGKTNETPDLDEYLLAKDVLVSTKQEQQELQECLKNCVDKMIACDADILTLEKTYKQNGGTSQEEWNNKLVILKEEEKKRESYNALLKKWSNEIVPFLMIREQVLKVKEQIEKESSAQKIRHFLEVLDSPAVKNIIRSDYPAIMQAVSNNISSTEKVILDLSLEQSAVLLGNIHSILSFDANKVAKCKKAIKKSLALTAKIRAELGNSNISSVHEYMQQRAKLFENKSLLLVRRIELERQLAENKEALILAETELSRIQIRLEEELKQASIKDISTRAIVMLDNLQQRLYRSQINKVEAFFRSEIKILMRKTHFIDNISIDDDFNIKIYRNEEIQVSLLINVLKMNTESQINSMLGNMALKKLYELSATSEFDEMIRYFNSYEKDTVQLPVEIDKTSLSNGEKQIFIMTLYHSLVQLCDHEIPFVIDTPFARIDTEHRKNISMHFFSKLKGQVFILSTNEEIGSTHFQIMKDKIAATYMLENIDNKRTIVVSDRYFEV